MTARAGRITVLQLALAVALGAAACQPAKKAPPGGAIAYYVSSTPGTGFRSVAPHTFTLPSGGTSAQGLLPDGSVALAITGSTDPAVKDGFLIVPIRLGDLQSVQVQFAAGPPEEAGVDLFLDKDSNGDYLQWDADGNYVPGVGGDIWAVDTNVTPATATVDDSTQFIVGIAPDGVTFVMRTLGQLKAGAEPGIGPNTMLQIFVFIGVHPPPTTPTSTDAVATSVLLNGAEVLLP